MKITLPEGLPFLSIAPDKTPVLKKYATAQGAAARGGKVYAWVINEWKEIPVG